MESVKVIKYKSHEPERLAKYNKEYYKKNKEKRLVYCEACDKEYLDISKHNETRVHELNMEMFQIKCVINGRMKN